MRNRSQRVLFSLIAVLGAFFAYRLVLVPLIEPNDVDDIDTTPVASVIPEGSPIDPHADSILERLFPPGSWQRDNPIVLENERAILLMHEYKSDKDDPCSLALLPCTMILLPSGDQAIDDTLIKRAIVLDAPKGAYLKFDEPVDLRKAKFGNLIGGRMPGEITIRGNPNGYHGQDEIYAKTTDIQLKPDEVWTPKPVDFRIGPNSGHGKEMHIKLLAGPAGQKRGLNFAGAQSLELKYEVKMHVVPSATGMLPGDRTGSIVGSLPRPGLPRVLGGADSPVDISCTGSFFYQLAETTATFHENVNVVRSGGAVQSDQLSADKLTIRFAQRARPGDPPPAAADPAATNPATPATANRGGSLEPVALTAVGHPVILRAPSNEGFIQGQRIEYDIPTQRLTVEAEERGEATMRQGINEIRTQRLTYQPGEAGRLGQVVCTGPGWLKGASPTNAKQIWEAKWKSEFRVNPHEQQQVVTLLGQAQLKMAEAGQLDGDEIYLWLNQVPVPPTAAALASDPKAPPRMQAIPDRLMARGNVSFDSAAANGATDRFEVWFKYAAVTPVATMPRTPVGGFPVVQQISLNDDGEAPPRMAANPFSRRPDDVAGRSPVFAPGQATITPLRQNPSGAIINPFVNGLGATPPGPPQQHFEVHGKLIRLQLLSTGSRTQLDDVSIEGDAILDETQTADPKDRPLHLEGQQVQVFGAASPNTKATVTGKPAVVRARGLGLTGGTVQFDRGANRIWIDGPGRMLLPLDRGLDGRPLAQPRPLEIVWEGKMNFDGLLAHFEQKIDAHTELQSLQTEVLDVTFAKKIDFQQPPNRQPPQLSTVVCQGNVLMESRAYDGPRQTAWERLQTKDLNINQTTGELNAQGPGWMTSYRTRTADDAANPLAGNPLNPRPPAAAAIRPAADDGTLQYVNVQFLRDITGNINQREMTFHEQVRVLYGPVKDWNEQVNADRIENLGPRGALMTCNSLKVVEMVARPPARGSIELEARENVMIEAQTFTARAGRASYAQAKELFVLEGDGRDDAQLFRQQSVGGPMAKAVARKILYWRSTNRVEMDDARFFDFGQMSGGNMPRGLSGLPGAASTPPKK